MVVLGDKMVCDIHVIESAEKSVKAEGQKQRVPPRSSVLPVIKSMLSGVIKHQPDANILLLQLSFCINIC